jgi:NTE family protein
MWENLVLAGGATYGYTYLGALRLLEERGVLQNFKRFAGTSVGAAICAFFACGATVDFVEKSMMELNVPGLKDKYKFFTSMYHLVKNYGYYKGDKAMEWISQMLKSITGNEAITFGELYNTRGKILVIVGTSLLYKEAVYFTHTSHPDMEIRQAIRISISIPLAYKAVKWGNDLWVDGGIVDNYPIEYFDEPLNPKFLTLGLKPVKDDEYNNALDKINNIYDYIDNLLETILLQVSGTPMDKYNEDRTVLINAGKLSSMNFNITKEDKIAFIEAGKKAMQEYLYRFPI